MPINLPSRGSFFKPRGAPPPSLCYNKSMKTLFAAFGGATNSSQALLELIHCPPADKLFLKNSFKTAPAQLRTCLTADDYDLVLLFGQRKMQPTVIRLETVARDNRVAYHTTVNFPELARRFATAGFDPVISKDAGRYLCNHIYLQALRHLDEHPLHAKVLFIHIPKLRQRPDLEKIAATLTTALDETILIDPGPL